jgi:hypothetical protein
MNLAFLLLAATLQTRPSLTIVSYRIAAPPNAVIRYAGEDYKAGSNGSIELINNPTISGTGTVAVTAGPGCGWTAVSNDSWVKTSAILVRLGFR